MKQNIKLAAFIVASLLFLAGIGWVKYKVFRLKHPDAPAWVYFVSPG